MLLTLRTPGVPEGFARVLEHGDARAVRTLELAEGRAHLFRPCADAVALMLEPPPAGRVPGVNAYTAGARMGEALAGFFTLSAGTDDPPLVCEARISVLPCAPGDTLPARLFGPLGYTASLAPLVLDPERPRMGESRFCSVTLGGRQRPRDLLSHLRVLLPLFDPRPPGADMGAELWERGRAWLETHAERALLERLLQRRPRGGDLHDRRHEAVVAALRASGARRVVDLGCGTGLLLRRLLAEPRFDEVVGVEVSRARLAEAAARLEPGGRGRVLHGSVVYRDARLAGFDAAVAVEVLEHLEPSQLPAFEAAVWDAVRPATVVLTTPNAEFNALFPDLPRGRLRHPEHRFEWTRAEFRAWARGVAATHGYAVRFADVGAVDAQAGPLTQMAVFDRLPDVPARGGAPGPGAAFALGEVAGERTVPTRLGGQVHVTADEAAAALEATSRVNVHPRWLVYLPPTTPEALKGLEAPALEHPRAALAYYRAHGVPAVALEELHAGTPVAVVVCRGAQAALRRFGAAQGETGAVYSARGRSFFASRAAEEAFLARIRAAMDGAGAWDSLATDWVALEGVIGPGTPLMPEVDPCHHPRPAERWEVAAAARGALRAAEAALASAVEDGVEDGALLARTRERRAAAGAYLAACRRAPGPVRTPGALRFAPTRLLASERGVYAGHGARWHRERLAPLCRAAPEVFRETEQVAVELADPAADAAAAAWWKAAAAGGAAGMVVRPLDAARGGERTHAPALKCRGADALRLVHGPEYRAGENREPPCDRAAARAADRAAREWALSIEALERFVRREPLARVHGCVLGALGVKTGP